MNRVTFLYLIAEFGPVLTFFIFGQLTTFYTAVVALMLSTTLAGILSWRLEKHVPFVPLISALFVLIGGLVTLFYTAPDAIIIADTLYYALLGATLLFYRLRGVLVFKHFFNRVFAMSDTGWHVLTRNWVIALLVAAIANEIARYITTPEVWIDYRFYKTIAVTLFACSQFYVSRTYRLPKESNRWGLRNTN